MFSLKPNLFLSSADIHEVYSECFSLDYFVDDDKSGYAIGYKVHCD